MRLYSGLCGYTKAEDRLPKRFHEPLPRGASGGKPIDPELFRKEIDEYYRIRGWDEHGPTRETLERLGLVELVKML
jgi:aldehyde:ferredoxin oxidoreductase